MNHPTGISIALGAVYAFGLALSLRSALVLDRRRSVWTFAGWISSAAYFLGAGFFLIRATHVPLHADYALLVVLAGCFAIAGRRDEPQAEPWWWPRAPGLTGRERARAKASLRS